MTKILKEKTVFRFSKPFGERIQWKDIKHFDIQDDDVIEISREEENESNDWRPDWNCYVTRMVEETDEEYENRLQREARDAIWAKQQRYQSYLRLKQEFEAENGK